MKTLPFRLSTQTVWSYPSSLPRFVGGLLREVKETSRTVNSKLRLNCYPGDLKKGYLLSAGSGCPWHAYGLLLLLPSRPTEMVCQVQVTHLLRTTLSPEDFNRGRRPGWRVAPPSWRTHLLLRCLPQLFFPSLPLGSFYFGLRFDIRRLVKKLVF